MTLLLFSNHLTRTSFSSEIIGAIQDPDAGVTMGAHLRAGVVYNSCFTGEIISHTKTNISSFTYLLKLSNCKYCEMYFVLKHLSGVFFNIIFRLTTHNLMRKKKIFII